MSVKPEDVLVRSPHEQRVIINVGGRRFETLEATLQTQPHTLLADVQRRAAFFDAARGEFFFDRSGDTFELVLSVYRTGRAPVPKPDNVPLKVVLDDLHFYGLTEQARYLEAQHGPKPVASGPTSTRGWRQKLWSALEPAPGSFPVVPALSTLLTLAIIVTWTVLTLPALEEHIADGLVAETVFAAFVLLELALRGLCSPGVRHMVADPLTWIDAAGSIPLFVGVGFSGGGGRFGHVLVGVARLAWALRLWRLVRHTRSATLIRHALVMSAPALGVCLLVWVGGVLFFAPILYWLECTRERYDTTFTSVPASVWFTVVTMTTLGYGDMVPWTAAGKVFASWCAYCGHCMLVLPVAIVVTNFYRLSSVKNV